jgi:HlyD family secretion protein
VRLQSTTQDNVVSYTAVVSVANDGKLRPGMTATVKFITAQAENVLTVPSAALRITPTDAMKQSAGISDSARQTRATGVKRDSLRQQFAGRAPGAARGSGGFGLLWTVDSTGKYSAIRVHTGLSDGQKTEVQGPALHEGEEIVVSLMGQTATPATQQATTTTNPLSPQRRMGGRGM